MAEQQEQLTETAKATTTEAPEVTTTPTEAPKEFVDTLSDDLQGLSNLRDFKSANELAKSYVELQRMVGNSVRIPAEDASDEAKQDFLDKIKDVDGVLIKNDEKLFDKLGRPEAPEKYNLEELVTQELAGIPEIGQEVENFKALAHEIGLTEDQARKLVDNQVQQRTKQIELQQAVRTDSEQELRKAWGQEYDNRIAAAKQAATIYSEKHGDAMSELIHGPAGNNPALIHILADLAEGFKEKGHEGMQATNFGMTPEMALDKIAEKRADPGFMKAYTDDIHPGHKKAVADLAKLYQIANGG